MSGKAVVALCATSFLVGLLLSVRMTLLTTPPSAPSSGHGSGGISLFADDCDQRRKLEEGNPKDIMKEVSRLENAPSNPVAGQVGVVVGDGVGGGAGEAERWPGLGRAQGRPPQGVRGDRHQHGLQQQEAPRLAPRHVGSPGRQAAAAGRGPVRDRAQRDDRWRAGPSHRRGGGGDGGLHAARPRGGVPRAVGQDPDLLRRRGGHLGRRILRQGGRRRARQPGDADEQAGKVQVQAQGVRRLHEVRPGSVALQHKWMVGRGVKYHEPEYWKFGDEGNKYFRHATGQIYAVSRDLASYISINQPILHRFANEDVSLGAWLLGLEVEHVDDRSLCCAMPPALRTRPDHSPRILKREPWLVSCCRAPVKRKMAKRRRCSVASACRLRVEEAGREGLRGVLRLVVQRHLQVRRQDANNPQRLSEGAAPSGPPPSDPEIPDPSDDPPQP